MIKKSFDLEILKSEEFQVGEDSLIKVILYKNKEGIKYIDIRKYYLSNEGKWLPTQKGIMISISDVDNPALDILSCALKFIKED